MEEQMLTLEKFEEASEVVKRVTLETKLVYSDFLSSQTGNKVYLKPENMQFTGAYKLRGAYRGNRHRALQALYLLLDGQRIKYGRRLL